MKEESMLDEERAARRNDTRGGPERIVVIPPVAVGVDEVAAGTESRFDISGAYQGEPGNEVSISEEESGRRTEGRHARERRRGGKDGMRGA
ncbi:hypothetical protein KM043_002634 [Ampulex compressa]|nr:hypothetical protein KM043_002634 [Ampulex compressa]